MYELKIKKSFEAAHFLRNYQGRCENMHGHGYVVEVYIRSQKLNEIGYVMDFTKIKMHLDKVLSSLDHHCLNELDFFSTVNPTAENIACYIFEKLNDHIEENSSLYAVEVWETGQQSAKYMP